MVALILSRKKSTAQYKVDQLVRRILFEIEENIVQASEVQYVFHLVSNHVQATTSGLPDLPSSFENQMMKTFFGAEAPDEFTSDLTETQEMITIIARDKVCIDLFKLLVDDVEPIVIPEPT